jgi:predicted nucleic-acid-binding protein
MAALDTNVLVRWLTNDDAQQSRAAERLFAQTVSSGERLFVSVTVMLELEWVLRSRYRFPRADVTATLDGLLSAMELELENEPVVEQALWHHKQTGAPNFADCLHAALVRRADRGPMWTLDEQAARLEGVRLMEIG